ncbi:hypothetical protein BS17DRAFT_690707, partial [Gyrodon lividus]
GIVEVPGGVFPSESGEQDNNIGVVEDEATIEVGEPEEGLNVLDFPGFGPISDRLDFLWGHGQSLGGEMVAQVFDGVQVPLTFLWFGVKSVFPETPKDFLDMFFMRSHVVGINEGVVEVDDDADIKEICKDTIDKALEGHRGVGEGIGEPKGHHQPLVQAVVSLEGGFPFIPRNNANKVICVAEVDFGIYLGAARGIEEVGDQG